MSNQLEDIDYYEMARVVRNERDRRIASKIKYYESKLKNKELPYSLRKYYKKKIITLNKEYGVGWGKWTREKNIEREYRRIINNKND